MKLHKNQELILNTIKKDPTVTVRDICRLCGFSSTAVAQHHLMALQAKGKIKKLNQWEIIE